MGSEFQIVYWFNLITGMEVMLTQLSNIAGSVDIKRKFIKSLEKEALRFKRRKLAKVFIEEQEKL